MDYSGGYQETCWTQLVSQRHSTPPDWSVPVWMASMILRYSKPYIFRGIRALRTAAKHDRKQGLLLKLELLLVDTETGDIPVRIAEARGVVVHMIDAGLRAGGRIDGIVSSPVTAYVRWKGFFYQQPKAKKRTPLKSEKGVLTKSQVDNDVLRSEMRGKIARVVDKVGVRRSPSGW